MPFSGHELRPLQKDGDICMPSPLHKTMPSQSPARKTSDKTRNDTVPFRRICRLSQSHLALEYEQLRQRAAQMYVLHSVSRLADPTLQITLEMTAQYLTDCLTTVPSQQEAQWVSLASPVHVVSADGLYQRVLLV